MTLSYVYALVKSARRPSVAEIPAGMPGAVDLRAVKAGDALWAIVASVPSGDYDEAALARGLQDLDWVARRAMAHEAVVEHFLASATVLPMQLFTLFTSDERAVDDIALDRARIDEILARIAGQLEWGLRLSFDEQAAKADVGVRVSRGAGKADAQASGTSYLARKRDLIKVSRVQLAEARAEADRLYLAMAGEATEAQRRTATEQGTPGSRLLLDAAFLVPVRRAGAFRTALRRHTRELSASGIVVSLTGPWPAYNFIDGRAPASKRQRAKSRTARKPASSTRAKGTRPGAARTKTASTRTTKAASARAKRR